MQTGLDRVIGLRIGRCHGLELLLCATALDFRVESQRHFIALAAELANAASTDQVLALGRSALEAGFLGPHVLALKQDGGHLEPGTRVQV